MGWWTVFTRNVSCWKLSILEPTFVNGVYCLGIPCVTDCVMAELEKLGHRYRVALRYVHFAAPHQPLSTWYYRIARDPRFERLRCSHSGTYADDCLVQRVTAHKCYIVATCDRELRRRVRQIPGVPLMYIVRRRYAIERLPDQGAPSWFLIRVFMGLAWCLLFPWRCSLASVSKM